MSRDGETKMAPWGRPMASWLGDEERQPEKQEANQLRGVSRKPSQGPMLQLNQVRPMD